MRRLLFLCSLLSLAGLQSAAAATIITATITVTNTAGTTNGQTLTVNSNTRTWTNSVSVPASQILTNNSVAGCATNLFTAVADSPFTGLSLGWLTNGITLQTVTPNGPLTASLSAGWGTVTLATNTLTSGQLVRVPLSVEYSTNQTNIATYLAQGLESSTYGLSSTAPVLSNYDSLTQVQTITGKKTLVAPITIGEVANNPDLVLPILVSGTNTGNALSSQGTNAGTEQFGAQATATGLHSLAVGFNAYAPSAGSTSLGYNSQAAGASAIALGASPNAFGDYSICLGFQSTSQGTNSTVVGTDASTLSTALGGTAIGYLSECDSNYSTALGYNSWGKYAYSTAIGYNVTTTGTNQVRVGTTAETVSIPGNLEVGGSVSNITFRGTNSLPVGADISFARYSMGSIVNGNNAGVVVGTNVFVEITGPTLAFSICGIAGGRDGKLLILLNRTGQQMTLSNDSGVDPTPGNRIYNATGADRTIGGNCAAILIYSGAASHWINLVFTN